MTYPHSAGYARTSATSEEAARSIAPELGARQMEVLGAVRLIGASTCDEIAAYLGRPAYVVRPRVTELCALGYLEDSGAVRRAPTQRSATVWQVKVSKDTPENQIDAFEVGHSEQMHAQRRAS